MPVFDDSPPAPISQGSVGAFDNSPSAPIDTGSVGSFDNSQPASISVGSVGEFDNSPPAPIGEVTETPAIPNAPGGFVDEAGAPFFDPETGGQFSST